MGVIWLCFCRVYIYIELHSKDIEKKIHLYCLLFHLFFFLLCLVINSTHWDLQLCFQFHLFLLNPTTLHFFSFLQAVYSGPGQLWDVQCGPAPHPPVQRGPPALLPRVAGEDLRAAWHQSGAEGHPREVSAASSCTQPSRAHSLFSWSFGSQPQVDLWLCTGGCVTKRLWRLRHENVRNIRALLGRFYSGCSAVLLILNRIFFSV